jgi:hypothetical protein
MRVPLVVNRRRESKGPVGLRLIFMCHAACRWVGVGECYTSCCRGADCCARVKGEGVGCGGDIGRDASVHGVCKEG